MLVFGEMIPNKEMGSGRAFPIANQVTMTFTSFGLAYVGVGVVKNRLVTAHVVVYVNLPIVCEVPTELLAISSYATNASRSIDAIECS